VIADDVDETPTAALLAELEQSYAWRQVQARLVARRDQFVSSLTGLNPEKTHEIAHQLGYIKALNEIAATPGRRLDKARKKLEKAT
jgi:hypothetical protein